MMMVITFERDSLPVCSDNASLLEDVCSCASNLVPVSGQVLVFILSLEGSRFFWDIGTEPLKSASKVFPLPDSSSWSLNVLFRVICQL